MWCVPELNDEYIEKMEDVLGTYEQPYDPAEPVICLDEKPITLHAEVRPPSAAEPGREARRAANINDAARLTSSARLSRRPGATSRLPHRTARPSSSLR